MEGSRYPQDPADFGYGQQRFEDVLVERLARQRSVVLTGYALAVMSHGEEGNDIFHNSLIIPNRFNFPFGGLTFFPANGMVKRLAAGQRSAGLSDSNNEDRADFGLGQQRFDNG